MKKQTPKKGSKAMKMAVIGAGLAGLAATAYFLFGPKGKKHQTDANTWAVKMKNDVVEKLKKAGSVSEPTYHKIIDAVTSEYQKGKKAAPKEIKALALNLKKHWQTISDLAKSAKLNNVKEAEKSASKTKKAV